MDTANGWTLYQRSHQIALHRYQLSVGECGMVRTINGIRVPIGDDKPPKGNRAVAGAAVVIMLAAVAGGGSVGAMGASGAADEFSLSVRNSRGQAEVRFRGSNDSLKVTMRLRRLGYHPTTLDSQSDTACDRYADSEAQHYLTKHRCVSINRTLIEIRERNYAVRFATATIEMPDYASAEGLSALLTKEGGGDITPLFPKSGRYRGVPFVSASSHTTWHDTVVINTRVQGVGRTPGTEVLASLGVRVLFSLD